MKPALILVAALAAGPTLAQPAATSRPISVIDRTLSGQPIALPQGQVVVTFSETVVPAGGAIPPHKHPYPRYAYVVSGRLKVTNLVTGTVSEVSAGQLAVDAIDQWHEAAVVGAEPVRMLVIDQAPPGVQNSVRKP
ncbi:cupin domain-containing protein [Phenylobacterium sp. J367]|uniref:cupin domain-containing protein n=1 Tax=Phenylobacterium sp. J367 TaxID=2898435 RepID=UPI0021519473|nr:cupin domain-containing protein [Phenylobacterium sp. J367]MCR5877047.1 cupin domain-containing protein [Phenylobacterium sp. J367]